MKKLILISILTLFISKYSSAKGIPMPYCSGCEYITIVEDLPDSASFYSEEHKAYLDLGFTYTQIWALWVPLWNTAGEYVYTIKGEDIYFELSEEELNDLKEKYNFKLSANPIPFWDKIGGKLLVVLILAGVLWSKLKPSKD